MKTLALLFFVLAAARISAEPALVAVRFQDEKIYYANLLERNEGSIRVEFLHTHSIYEFDKQGYVIASTGQYKPGARVISISIHPYKESLYSRESLHSISGDQLYIGVVFSDGKVYYGEAVATAEASWFAITFLHSGSHYIMHKIEESWKVQKNYRGSYPEGTLLIDIFSVPFNGEAYYNGGS